MLPRSNHDIDELNEMLKSLKHITFVDIASHLKDESNRFKEIYTLEGLHVSPLGYEVITDLLQTFLD